jgi:hypothetical protein
MSGRAIVLRITSVLGAVIGYGCFAAFLSLIGLQGYRWFREGEWPHLGMSEGLRAVLAHCCIKDGDAGRLAALAHWLEAPPVDWLGLHKMLEVLPASLALFALSIVGNCIFIYSLDRIDELKRSRPVAA